MHPYEDIPLMEIFQYDEMDFPHSDQEDGTPAAEDKDVDNEFDEDAND